MTTRAIAPRGNNEGALGASDKRWGTIYCQNLDVTNQGELASLSDVDGWSSANPLVNGAVSQGVANRTSRQDHVHPVDTSRAAADATVNLIGNQTIAGIKTHTSIPVLPASDPTEANQAARRQYVVGNFEPIIVVKNTAFNKNFGSAADTVCEGNDSRLGGVQDILIISIRMFGKAGF